MVSAVGEPVREDRVVERSFIRPFRSISNADVAAVGGKNASLGEMYRTLAPLGVLTADNGFAVTAEGYRYVLEPVRSSGRRSTRHSTASIRPTSTIWRPARAARARSGGRRLRSPQTCAPRFSLPTTRCAPSTDPSRSASPCAAPRPRRICRPPASPASTRAISMCTARRCCSTPGAAASRASSPIAPSTIGSTRASTISRSLSRSAS